MDIFSLEKLKPEGFIFFKRKHLSWVYQEGRLEKVAWSKIVSLLVFLSSCATAFYRRPNLFGHHDAIIYFLEIISLILFEDYSNMGLKWYNNFFFLSFLMVNLEALSSTTIRSRVKKQYFMLTFESDSLPSTATCYSSPYQDAPRSGCESRDSSLKRILRKKQKSCLDSFFKKGQIKDNNEGSVFVVFHCIHYVGQSSYVGFIHVDGEFIQLLLRYFTQMFMVRFNHLSSTEV